MRFVEQLHQRRRVGQCIGCGQRTIEEDLPIIEAAHVDRQRSRVYSR